MSKELTQWLGKKARMRCDALERKHVQREEWKYRGWWRTNGGRQGHSATRWTLYCNEAYKREQSNITTKNNRNDLSCLTTFILNIYIGYEEFRCKSL